MSNKKKRDRATAAKYLKNQSKAIGSVASGIGLTQLAKKNIIKNPKLRLAANIAGMSSIIGGSIYGTHTGAKFQDKYGDGNLSTVKTIGARLSGPFSPLVASEIANESRRGK